MNGQPIVMYLHIQGLWEILSDAQDEAPMLFLVNARPLINMTTHAYKYVSHFSTISI